MTTNTDLPRYGRFTSRHPQAKQATLVKSTVVRIPQSVYRALPGMDCYRPDQATGVPNFFLCGDYTQQDYLASMEGAVLSGKQAAQRIAASKHPIQTLTTMNQTILRQLQSPLTLSSFSMDVMERLRDCLTPPITAASPTRTQVRSGAYDGMHAHCIAHAQKPNPALRAGLHRMRACHSPALQELLFQRPPSTGPQARRNHGPLRILPAHR